MRMFLAAVILTLCLEFGLGVGLYLAFHDSTPSKAEAEAVAYSTVPPQRSDRYLEWYLRVLWDIHQQSPDSRVLAALYGRSDYRIQTYVLPRTGEDFETAKTRILSPLGPAPTDLEIHTAATLESHAVNQCAEQYGQRCYLLDFTHWTIASHVLAPLGQTTPYSDVVAGYYDGRPWADWTIPRPTE